MLVAIGISGCSSNKIEVAASTKVVKLTSIQVKRACGIDGSRLFNDNSKSDKVYSWTTRCQGHAYTCTYQLSVGTNCKEF